MTFKSSIATLTGKSSYFILSKFFNGGSSYPGKIAYKIDPDILTSLGKNYDLIIVTGTNGKTLTTSLINKMVTQKYDDVLTNPTGSNMIQGIVTSFVTHHKTSKKPLAVLEVDEANVEIICKYIKPKYFVLTNIFRDQMDRYGEIYTTYQKILNGIKLAPDATIIANGDAAIFSSKKLPNKVIYYGFSSKGHEKDDIKAPTNTDGVLCPNCNHIMHYHFISYANLGSYFCPNCGFKQNDLKYQVTNIKTLLPNKTEFEINGNSFTMNIGGKYNIYNALAAFAVASEMGITVDQMQKAFSYDEKVFGRQETITVDKKDVNIILVKNPVGLNQVIETILSDKSDYSLAFLLNANYADGIDTSWIWDANFEDFNYDKIPLVITGGKRVKDVTYRFKIAGLNMNKNIETVEIEDFVKQIPNIPTDKIYVLATYTAMMGLRKVLSDGGYIKK
ncbi:Mur ligase family protein [Companilactobacillus allii]|uniref:Lipid II isoglutaminyl synthase (glutamine-hydrolyzing) subunit MurT n=1 Tax=Companilactobacillus allii TaxID=1847728 RepID=A0A1P8Q5I5_9LACO|nr:Mur ligase family protein [Companilactobacillus allii]APX73095.1 UDP-N-acetylmuramyl peptide synthase [Companilactobacillus allii]USQ67896.1 Mur ligase family protein [Companilactobacillus allii]